MGGWGKREGAGATEEHCHHKRFEMHNGLEVRHGTVIQ